MNFDKFMELVYSMFMFARAYEPLDAHLQPNRVLVIYGPRRVGKTTLLQGYLKQTELKYKLDSGDNIRTQQILSSQDFNQILPYIEGYELLAIDEAQNIPNVGMGLKIIVDQVPGISVVVTGSSSFELAGQVGEPLTGRKRTLTLYPLAQSELLSTYNKFELREHLPDFLVFGAYPEVLQASTRQERIEVLAEIANAYLLKDILAFDRVKKSRTLLDLLKLLAFQVGNEVSLAELATQVGVDVKTIQRYLDLLEKAFVILRLGGFSRNLRQEVTNKSKYYFLDNGIRNAVIAQFNTLDQRNDIGALWENFMVMERLKYRAYAPLYANIYFWRTYGQQEIDLVEERDGKLFGYEFKWSLTKAVTPPKNWISAYPEAEFKVVHPDDYLEFVMLG
ncbi:MAG: ATP-binding protein [Anaerolineales bacterium]|nr:ATP-binding protein [Anaerolineales bacterium]